MKGIAESTPACMKGRFGSLAVPYSWNRAYSTSVPAATTIREPLTFFRLVRKDRRRVPVRTPGGLPGLEAGGEYSTNWLRMPTRPASVFAPAIASAASFSEVHDLTVRKISPGDMHLRLRGSRGKETSPSDRTAAKGRAPHIPREEKQMSTRELGLS